MKGYKTVFFEKDDVGRVRKAQEDSHGKKIGTPNGDLYVVCDGMGGHVGGAMASKIAVESIIEYIDKENYSNPIEALNNALQFANTQILGYAYAHPEYKGMGTTACIVLLQGDDVWIAHVGDSRIYLYLGKEGKLHRITKDHSYVQTLVDNGEITDEEAELHPNKNRITKALGVKPELQPTFNFENKAIRVKKGDIFLICSDGLCGMIPDNTIERVFGMKRTLPEKGEELFNLAMEGETVKPGGQDNCTLELIQIEKSVWKKSVFMSYNPERSNVSDRGDGSDSDLGNKKNIVKNAKLIIAVLLALLVIVFVLNVISSRHNDKLIREYTADSIRFQKEYDSLMVILENMYKDTLNIPIEGPNEKGFKTESTENAGKKLLEKKKKEIISNADIYKKNVVEPVSNKLSSTKEKLLKVQGKN